MEYFVLLLRFWSLSDDIVIYKQADLKTLACIQEKIMRMLLSLDLRPLREYSLSDSCDVIQEILTEVE